MTTPVRIAAAAVIGVLVVGVLLIVGRPGDQPAVGGAASPTPVAQSATPSASDVATPSAVSIPALTETFTSPRHGYSVRYPTGWTTQPATKPWTSGIDTHRWKSLAEHAGAACRGLGAAQGRSNRRAVARPVLSVGVLRHRMRADDHDR